MRPREKVVDARILALKLRRSVSPYPLLEKLRALRHSSAV